MSINSVWYVAALVAAVEFRMTPTLYQYQLSDVARGLAYLHQHGLVHGNLTGVSLGFLVQSVRLITPEHNILIDSNGIACVSGYGLETLLRDEASSRSIPTNVRWMAPEVLGAKSGHVPSENNGKATDVYSFAMIMFEVSLLC